MGGTTPVVIDAGGYDVLIGRGLLPHLPALLRERCRAHSYAVVADAHVAERHGPALTAALSAAELSHVVVSFPAGEWNKTRQQWAELTDRIIAAGLGRDAAVITFGGGVAGDLGGFVAATFMRGIPFVQVPTSLLAMVDASVGGKVGVDVAAGKNLVGAFHSPRFVLADVDLLATLPRPHLLAGMAEAIKHGVIADAAYFARLSDPAPITARDCEVLLSVVSRSVEIKAAVVREDPREAGKRAMLNFGHTVAHALEAVAGYSLLHGEALAVGMCVEAAVGEMLGVTAPGTALELRRVLDRYALPTAKPPDVAASALVEVMRRDKKNRAARIRLALPGGVGEYAQRVDGAWTVEVEEAVIAAALEQPSHVKSRT